MTRRPPTSTLFPYTTRFRSHARDAEVAIDREPLARRHALLAAAIDQREIAAAKRRDRKSTRLNSSHVEISYAVFCLKKKKNISDVVSIVSYDRSAATCHQIS